MLYPLGFLSPLQAIKLVAVIFLNSLYHSLPIFSFCFNLSLSSGSAFLFPFCPRPSVSFSILLLFLPQNVRYQKQHIHISFLFFFLPDSRRFNSQRLSLFSSHVGKSEIFTWFFSLFCLFSLRYLS